MWILAALTEFIIAIIHQEHRKFLFPSMSIYTYTLYTYDCTKIHRSYTRLHEYVVKTTWTVRAIFARQRKKLPFHVENEMYFKVNYFDVFNGGNKLVLHKFGPRTLFRSKHLSYFPVRMCILNPNFLTKSFAFHISTCRCFTITF